jgi:predicted RNA-binding Zn-ribbon protein involved in translation (DUF1610 family)
MSEVYGYWYPGCPAIIKTTRRQYDDIMRDVEKFPPEKLTNVLLVRIEEPNPNPTFCECCDVQMDEERVTEKYTKLECPVCHKGRIKTLAAKTLTSMLFPPVSLDGPNLVKKYLENQKSRCTACGSEKLVQTMATDNIVGFACMNCGKVNL